MSIESEMNRIEQNTINALSAVVEYGVDVPSDANSDNLSDLIRAIPKANIVQTTGDSTTDIMSQKSVTDALTSKSQLIPEYAESIDALESSGDPSKLYVLPDGYIYAYMKSFRWEQGYTNLVPTSKNSDGSIYNSTGYKLNTRLNSSALEKEFGGAVTIGFIPVTKDSVLRIKHFANGSSSYFSNSGNHIMLFGPSFELLTTSQQGLGSILRNNNIGTMDDSTGIYTVKISDIYDNDSISYVRFSTYVTTVEPATDADAAKLIVTVNEEIGDGFSVESYTWTNTDHAFVPADYESRIIDLEDSTSNQETRIKLLEANESGSGILDYWVDELETKADAIQQAMEAAGRNKSAFLWYTDSHWTAGNSKMSPTLLNYLYKHTPITKTIFGGDIIGDPTKLTHDAIAFSYNEWRNAISILPNHHSVIGNHDNNHLGSNDSNVANLVYSFLLAPEESPDMVMGGDWYYYIDNPCEKTRYLYLDSGRYAISDNETAFMIEALKTTPSGWHIVAISHIWFQYTASSTPTVGSMNTYMQKVLDLFDAYNARETGNITMISTAHTYDFSNADGTVEFCIGGHIHVDFDLASTAGIPVILTASDVNQNRSANDTEDSGTLGTTTEAAVFGIIANYTAREVSVVGVGRGTSRTVALSGNS